MLKQHAALMARLIWGISDLETGFGWQAIFGGASSLRKDQLLRPKEEEFIRQYLSNAKFVAEEMGLDSVPPQADRMLESLSSGNRRIDDVGRDLYELRMRIFDQVDSRLFYFVSPSVARYYTEKNLFGTEVDAAFPSASAEIDEAGKCRALGRYSATVFHLMRALEVGLRCLGKEFEVVTDHSTWRNILDLIGKKVRAMDSVSHGDNWKEEQQFYSEAVAHFYALKDAWRNYTMHLHERYGEERAAEIYDSVRAFMRGLSKKLKEPD